MKHLLRQCFLAFIFMAAGLQLTAATVTWDGGAGTSNWTDAMNWDTDALPTASDDVDLNGSTVVLSANATVQRVYAGGSSDLTINSGVTLTITGFAGGDDGLEVQNSGTVTNNGTIAISNIHTSNTDADGLYNKGMFTNNGTISVDGTGQHGIYLQGGTFTNNATGTISVTNAGQGDTGGDGIYVDDNGGAASTFNNHGTFTVTMTAADDCIYINDGSVINNFGTITVGGTNNDNGIRVDDMGVFNNHTGGTFTINTTPDDQLLLDNTCTFNNHGTVNLNNAADVGLYVTDDGLFMNDTTAAVNITGASNYAVQIDANSNTANIVNHGAINITGGSNDGVRIQEMGVFNNMTTGALNITNAGDEGIQIDDGSTPISTFNNSGMVSITTPTDHGMEVFGTFNNTATGTYKSINATDDGIRMRNAGIFNNDGAIRISGSGSDDIETDNTTFTNSATATFAPGDNGIGLMEIKDDFDMGAATVTFELADTTTGTGFDQIQNFSAGTAMTVSGATMHLDWGSYIPNVGDKFRVVIGSGDVTGTFSTVTSSNSNILTTVNYGTTDVEVEVTDNGMSSGSDSVNITFSVNTSWITVDSAGLFIAGGGNFGVPGDNPMDDSDGDGVWTITVRQPKGFSSHYTFTNGNCPTTWSCKEDILGQSCADPNNFNDRFLPGVWSDTTLTTCFAWCSDDGSCPVVKAQPDLPITFEDTTNINYALVDFGGDSSVITAAPDDPNNTVVESTKKAGAEVWAGTVVADNGLLNPIPFTATATTMSVRVWSPDANTPILLKVEDANDAAIASEVQANTTTSGAWEVLVFDFAAGTPALDLANTYDKIVIFFDFGNQGTGKTYYWDEIEFGGNVFTNELSIDNNLFSVRPNVTKDYTNIHFADNAITEEKIINVYNALGEVVMTEVVNNANIYRLDTHRFAAGMYFVNVQSENRMATKRLVIQE